MPQSTTTAMNARPLQGTSAVLGVVEATLYIRQHDNLWQSLHGRCMRAGALFTLTCNTVLYPGKQLSGSVIATRGLSNNQLTLAIITRIDMVATCVLLQLCGHTPRTAVPATDFLVYILYANSPMPTKCAISASTNRVSWSVIVLHNINSACIGTTAWLIVL